MAREYIELEKQAADREELEKITLGGLRRAVLDGDIKRGSVMMGQTAGLIKEVKTVEEVLANLINEAISLQNSLNAKIDKLKEIK